MYILENNIENKFKRHLFYFSRQENEMNTNNDIHKKRQVNKVWLKLILTE